MKESLKTEIIAVGTELLLGQIANTNAQWMSEQLAAHGINTYFHTVVGDNLERLKSVMRAANERSNVIIVSGGLGPTEDDLTREAFQAISHLDLLEDAEAIQSIEAYFRSQGIPMTPNNRRQARVFKHSMKLPNRYGMAPGNLVEYQRNIWIFLPGVPREMKQIFTDSVLPYLQERNGRQMIRSQVLRFIGIGESTLEHELQDVIASQENPTIAPLSAKDGITIRLTAKADSEAEVQAKLAETRKEILARIGQYCYGENDDTIEGKVFELLKEKNYHLAAAESLTGGAFQSKFISVDGASSVFKGGIVSYSKDIKTQVLEVSEESIAQHGTVSEVCASEMARQVAQMMQADMAISLTGVAGPSAIEGKEVGTVYIGLLDRKQQVEKVEACRFQGDRKQIRHRAVLKAFELLFRHLKKDENIKDIE